MVVVNGLLIRQLRESLQEKPRTSRAEFCREAFSLGYVLDVQRLGALETGNARRAFSDTLLFIAETFRYLAAKQLRQIQAGQREKPDDLMLDRLNQAKSITVEGLMTEEVTVVA